MSNERESRQMPLINWINGRSWGPVVLAEFAKIADALPKYHNTEDLNSANITLENGGSILIASNHPEASQAIYITSTIRKLRNYDLTNVALLISSKFGEGLMGSVGDSTLPVLKEWGIQPIEVLQTTREKDHQRRYEENLDSLRQALTVLKHPRSIVALFPEGTRSEQMKKAESGFIALARNSDQIILQTTEEINGRVNVSYQSIEGKGLIKEFRSNYGRKKGEKLYTVLCMSLIASKIKDKKKQGVYKKVVSIAKQVQAGDLNIESIKNQNLKELVALMQNWL